MAGFWSSRAFIIAWGRRGLIVPFYSVQDCSLELAHGWKSSLPPRPSYKLALPMLCEVHCKGVVQRTALPPPPGRYLTKFCMGMLRSDVQTTFEQKVPFHITRIKTLHPFHFLP